MDLTASAAVTPASAAAESKADGKAAAATETEAKTREAAAQAAKRNGSWSRPCPCLLLGCCLRGVAVVQLQRARLCVPDFFLAFLLAAAIVSSAAMSLLPCAERKARRERNPLMARSRQELRDACSLQLLQVSAACLLATAAGCLRDPLL